MIKSTLIAKLAEEITWLSEEQLCNAVNCILDIMSESLATGERIEIRGFGSFSLHYLQPRNAHNPKTGEKVLTKGKYVPHFKPGKNLKTRVNESALKTRQF